MTLLVGLNGSPRRGGNSATLLAEALAGGADSGAETLRFDLAFMDIAPCRACEACFSDGECVIEDGMTDLYQALERADAIIVASPIYFSGMSAQTKAAVDRCQALWARRQVLKLSRPPARGGIILCAAQPRARFDNAASELRAFLFGIGAEPERTLTFPGMEGPSAARERPDLLSQARELGRALTSCP